MDKNWGKTCFSHIFLEQKWGNSSNSGKGKNGSYKRRYSKTKKDKGLIKVDNQGNLVKQEKK